MRYEDVVERPLEQAEKLYAFMGVPVISKKDSFCHPLSYPTQQIFFKKKFGSHEEEMLRKHTEAHFQVTTTESEKKYRYSTYR